MMINSHMKSRYWYVFQSNRNGKVITSPINTEPIMPMIRHITTVIDLRFDFMFYVTLKR